MKNDNKKDWGKVRETLDTEMEMNEADDLASLFDEEDEVSGESESGEKKGNALEHPDYAELEQKLTLAEQKAHENWEKSVRALAEVDNMRRRKDREVENAHKYALEKFADSLLPVGDSLEQALQLTMQHGDNAMREGLELTMKIFLDVLEKNGIKQISPLGEVFNPQLHEAMSMQPLEGGQPNTISAVLQKGYLLNDRVIRPARVIVVKE